MIKLMIFDMAGTSIDEGNLVYKTIQGSIESFGIVCSLEEVLAHGAGKEKLQGIKDILLAKGLERTEDEVKSIHEYFKKSLLEAYDDSEMKVFDSVRDMIQYGKEEGIMTAFNTGYKRAMAEFILDKVGIEVGKDIDALVAADDVEFGRPHPDMIMKIIKDLGVSADEAIKIGDSAIDIEEGRAAGMALNIGVTTGAQTADQMLVANPDYIIADMSELKILIEEYNGKFVYQ